ncbi:hypothetical protein A6R68_05699, partial [Neotoma lepida]
KVAALAGCKTTTSAAMVHCLRQKTEEELLEVTLKMVGVSVPAPEEILAEKSFNNVPYMVGINKQEYGWIIPMNVSKNLIPAAIEEYLGGTDDLVKKKKLFLDLMGDAMFGVPSVIVARNHR